MDFQQFGGGMALNIQRALEGQPPSVRFSEGELFTARVDAAAMSVLLGRGARAAPHHDRSCGSVAVLLVGGLAARNFETWRPTAAPQSAREYAGRLWLVAAPALLAPAVVFMLGPHTIFTNNPGEFAVPFMQLAAPWLLQDGGASTGSSCSAWLRRRALVRARRADCTRRCSFGLGLALWGQGNLWNADYGGAGRTGGGPRASTPRARPYETGGVR